MESVRSPAVAGTFYPADPEVLRRTVESLLGDARPADPGIQPRMLIVPHAGYMCSGPVAATAYRLLQEEATGVGKVVLVGPSQLR